MPRIARVLARPASLDPAWLDAQYNNRARIPEHPQLFARWAAESQAARSALACHLDLRYGAHPRQTLDVFPSARTNGHAAPVLVFLHGGWWRSLDKSDHSFVAAGFVREGAMVVLPNYALAPEVGLEAIVLQLVDALAWVWRHAAEHGGDPQRITLAGHSAGGHLAAMLLNCRWKSVARDLPADLARRALAISGLYDLEAVRRTPFLKPDLRLTRAAVERLSPVRFAPPRERVLYAAAGALESEEFLRQNALIRAAWGELAVPVCETVHGCHHLDVLHTLAEPGGALHGRAWDLLRQKRQRQRWPAAMPAI